MNCGYPGEHLCLQSQRLAMAFNAVACRAAVCSACLTASSTRTTQIRKRQHYFCKKQRLLVKVKASTEIRVNENDNGMAGKSSRIVLQTLKLLEWDKLCDIVASFAGTLPGKQAVKEQLLSVSRSMEESNKLLLETTAGIQFLNCVDGNLDFSSLEATQVASCINRLPKGAVLEGKDALAIASLVQFCAQLQSTLRILVKENASWHNKLMPISTMLSDLLIHERIVREIYKTVDEGGVVKDDASSGLKMARARVHKLEQQVYKLLGTLLSNDTKEENFKEISFINGRWCIKATKDRHHQFQGLLLKNSRMEQYLEPISAVTLNDELTKAKALVLKMEHEALLALTKKVLPLVDNIEDLFISIVSLDVIIARAKYSMEYEGVNPMLHSDYVYQPLPSEESIMEDCMKFENLLSNYQENWLLCLRKLYHPLLLQKYWEKTHRIKDKTLVCEFDHPIPIDILVKRRTKVVIITGPNTGGKTATIKTLGLAVLMAKSGLYVLAEEPVQIPCFDYVLADIGDEQSLSHSLSTFSGHLQQIQAIKAESTKRSLVLLDELGAGTNPLEGAALGLSLLESFAEGSSLLTIATTHLGELKALKYSNHKCENACVEFDEETLRPTYKLLWGIPGQSNALSIAERLGLPFSIVNDARAIYGNTRVVINKVIMDLENAKRQLQNDVSEIEQYIMEAKDLHQKLVHVNAQVLEHYVSHEQHLKYKVLEAAAEARSSLHRIVRKYRQRKHESLNDFSAPSGNSVMKNYQQRKHESLNDSFASSGKEEKINESNLLKSREHPLSGTQFIYPSVGQEVYVPSIGKKARVLKVREEREEITVQSGNLRINIKIDQLRD